MKKLMILAAFLGVLTVATGAEAREYCDPPKSHYHHGKSHHSNKHHGKWHKPVKYQTQIKKVVVYPPSCYAVKTDWFGHHTRILRPVCSRNAHLYTKVYYSPQPYGRR